MSQTDEEIREMVASLRESAGGKYALGPAEYWHIDRAADALESLRSDLSSAREAGRILAEQSVIDGKLLAVAREEIAELEAVIQSMQRHYNPGADSFDTAAAREALRSSRSKGE